MLPEPPDGFMPVRPGCVSVFLNRVAMGFPLPHVRLLRHRPATIYIKVSFRILFAVLIRYFKLISLTTNDKQRFIVFCAPLGAENLRKPSFRDVFAPARTPLLQKKAKIFSVSTHAPTASCLIAHKFQ